MFCTSANCATTRNTMHSVNRATARQLSNRSLYVTVFKRWGSLTVTQVNSWRLFSYNGLSGRDLFVSVNICRVRFGFSIVLLPPALNFTYPPVLASAYASSALSYLRLVYASALSGGTGVMVYGTKPMSAGRKAFDKDYRLLVARIFGGQTTVELFSYFQSVFGSSLVAGKCIYLKVKYMGVGYIFKTDYISAIIS